MKTIRILAACLLTVAIADRLPAQDNVAMPIAAPNLSAAPADKGRLIVFRSGTVIGGAVSCAVHENGAKLTSLPPGHYAILDIAPGSHDFSVESEAKSTLHVDLSAGQTSYGLCTVGMGAFAGHPHLRLSDAATFSGMQAKLKPVVPK